MDEIRWQHVVKRMAKLASGACALVPADERDDPRRLPQVRRHLAGSLRPPMTDGTVIGVKA